MDSVALPFTCRGQKKYLPSGDTVKEPIAKGQKAMYN